MSKQNFKQLRIDEEAEKIAARQAMIKSNDQPINSSQSDEEQSTKQSWD